MLTLTALEILAYGIASALYLGFISGTRKSAASAARTALLVGVVAQFVDIGVRCLEHRNPLSSTPDAMALIGFLIGAGFLGVSVRHHLAAAGAFAAPGILTLVLLARVVPGDGAGPEMGALGRVHIFLATLGVAVFALAAMLAVLYLFEDRKLKRKEFGRMIGLGAPLVTLDRLAHRCVSFGFPVFTVALITGALWMARTGMMARATAFRPEYLLAIVAWLAFGVLLVARVGRGWRGRRAAWLTLGGFGGAALVVAAYFLRHVV